MIAEVYCGTWNIATQVALKKLKSQELIKEFTREAKILMYFRFL